ncbi:MAG: type VI secretion system baseplate subunit TssG [Gammaproteobacteria bacterium]|nr:type VI secretion system baseplate subunit TssG [Gammaproteobacteria bacterium]
MAGTSGNRTAELIAELSANPEAFSLFQALRLLQREGTKRGRIKIEPQLSLATPVAELSRIEIDDESGITLETTRAALYGASSPLPDFLTEELIDSELEEPGVAKMLLDTIHQRLFDLDDAVVRDGAIPFNHVERGDKRFSELLYTFLGLRGEIKESLSDPHLILRYGRLFGRKQRSAAGLTKMVANYLPGCQIKVEQCVLRSLRLPQSEKFTLGSRPNALGYNTILGERIDEGSGKLIIHVTPEATAKDSNLQWFYQQKERDQLVELIRLYLDTPLACDLQVALPRKEVSAPFFGEERRWTALGETTWLVGNEGDDMVQVTLKVQ